MGVRRFEDLIVWQLATELKERIAAILERPEVRRDVKFCDQIRESSRSAPRNIAEGFGRFGPREFMRYLRIASGSLHETKNHLHEARSRGYIDDLTHVALTRLTLRTLKANWKLQQYLKGAEPPDVS